MLGVFNFCPAQLQEKFSGMGNSLKALFSIVINENLFRFINIP